MQKQFSTTWYIGCEDSVTSCWVIAGEGSEEASAFFHPPTDAEIGTDGGAFDSLQLRHDRVGRKQA